jgi:hypothetical protein
MLGSGSYALRGSLYVLVGGNHVLGVGSYVL